MMDKQMQCRSGQHPMKKGHGVKGPSSFHMQDPRVVFNALNVQQGDFFLDLGCGAGDYSLHASKLVGNSGKVYAFDVLKDTVTTLNKEIERLKITNINTGIADMTRHLPLGDGLFDICFISTVLHTFDVQRYSDTWCNEVKRVLKKSGRAAIIECKKEEQHFGPPLHMKISHHEVETLMLQYGFVKNDYIDLGFNYLLIFSYK